MVDDNTWPYKIEISWACFMRRYRYKAKEAFQADWDILKQFCGADTEIIYIGFKTCGTTLFLIQ